MKKFFKVFSEALFCIFILTLKLVAYFQIKVRQKVVKFKGKMQVKNKAFEVLGKMRRINKAKYLKC